MTETQEDNPHMPETVTIHNHNPMPLRLHHPAYPDFVIANGGNHPDATHPPADRFDRTGHTPGVSAAFWRDWCAANAGHPAIITSLHAEPVTPTLWATPEENTENG